MYNSGGEIDVNAVGVVTFFVYLIIISGLVILIKLLISMRRHDKEDSGSQIVPEPVSDNSQDETLSRYPARICSSSTYNLSSDRPVGATKSTEVRSEHLAMMGVGFTRKVAIKPNTLIPKMVNYNYVQREYLMTQNERTFYKSLFNAVGKKYLIFPQIHLDALFRYNLKNQYHQAAFRAIRGYSVDYVLCCPDFQIVCAIELDDSTHQKPERRARDEAVESIFTRTGLPLVRIPLNRPMNYEELSRYIFSCLR